MPSKSKAQFRFFKAVENNPEFAEKTGVSKSIAKEMTKGNKGNKRFSKLKDRIGKKNERKDTLY
jgi:hypothetical protein